MTQGMTSHAVDGSGASENATGVDPSLSKVPKILSVAVPPPPTTLDCPADRKAEPSKCIFTGIGSPSSTATVSLKSVVNGKPKPSPATEAEACPKSPSSVPANLIYPGRGSPAVYI